MNRWTRLGSALIALAATAAYGADTALQDEVLHARPVAAPSDATPADAAARPGLSSGVDLELPLHADAPTAAAVTYPLNAASRSALERLLGANATDSGSGTFDYTALPRELDDSARYGEHADQQDDGYDATISMTAGTGGLFQTRASVTVPLIEDELTIRVSGVTGSGYSGGYRNDYMGRDGRRYFESARAVDGTSLGLELLWTPSDDVRVEARTSEHSSRSRNP